jgi:hypothetical protein
MYGIDRAGTAKAFKEITACCTAISEHSATVKECAATVITALSGNATLATGSDRISIDITDN